MNTYITELSSMVPMCGAMARKLDKLTVLRLAVQHMRTVRGTLSACPLTPRPRPAFLSEKELNSVILQAAQECFVLVVGCDRGRLMYVSASVKRTLLYDQNELLGQSLFDILHPKDVAKVKEQLTSLDLSPRERFIDAKTMMPLKADVVAGASRFCPGARRSFICRIKCKLPHVGVSTTVKEEDGPSSKLKKKQQQPSRKYCVVQCTGYLKSWSPANVATDNTNNESNEDLENSNMSCLVAVGRILPDFPVAPVEADVSPVRLPQFVSRHATDGKFLFVDQRVTIALGFLPQELLGTSLYVYINGPELSTVARAHKVALMKREPLVTPPYAFRRKDGTFARIQTHFKPFKNPWSKEIECLIANNTVLREQTNHKIDQTQTGFDLFLHENDAEMQQLIDSQVESHKIGSAIAEEVLGRSPAERSPELPTDLLQDPLFNQQILLADSINASDLGCNQVRNNVSLAAAGVNSSPTDSPGLARDDSAPPSVSPPLSNFGVDGNEEAVKAVIMSLLEADAGLEGPVHFSGLPWPLP
ncbi:Aryl hydrocarbon receptor nuclear translocator-like protein 1 [Eumeta japonica]|uniref:Aryl hydrocarbon receptor nuclear translocator-like protein 1 n=1 Tax=Eumeta variegata TaxID=151549 RepID=A0A4C2AFF3_EUMVA|nr:Aryl hydrocarbon receptor nuclear translocator-like protein 1 [Eumeta japonica]